MFYLNALHVCLFLYTLPTFICHYYFLGILRVKDEFETICWYYLYFNILDIMNIPKTGVLIEVIKLYYTFVLITHENNTLQNHIIIVFQLLCEFGMEHTSLYLV